MHIHMYIHTLQYVRLCNVVINAEGKGGTHPLGVLFSIKGSGGCIEKWMRGVTILSVSSKGKIGPQWEMDARSDDPVHIQACNQQGEDVSGDVSHIHYLALR